MKRTEKIKNHLRENKKTYIACGGTAILAVLATLIATRDGDVTLSKFNVKQTGVVNNNTNLEVYIEALGDPGNIVQDLASGTVYASQGQAAKELGTTPVAVSRHLNGHTDHVNGHKLVRLGKAPVAE